MGSLLPLALLGFALGILGTLLGTGGGFILVPVLLLLYPADPPAFLTSVSLAVVFLNAASGTVAYVRMNRVDFRSGLIFAAAGIPGAVLGAMTTAHVSRKGFEAVFGILLLLLSVWLILKPGSGEATLPGAALEDPESSPRGRDLLGSGLSLVVGYVSSLLGIGGGILHVPLLVRVLRFPVHIATATSHFILAIMAFTGTAVHVASGVFTHGLRRTSALGVGVVVGAQLGAILSRRLHGAWIIRGLAAGLGFMGARVLWRAFGPPG